MSRSLKTMHTPAQADRKRTSLDQVVQQFDNAAIWWLPNVWPRHAAKGWV